MIETDESEELVQRVFFSTTATIREAIEANAEEPVIISVPIGGDTSEFE